MLCDYHVHTAFSDDSEYPIEQVVQDAIGLGLKELCFTDHVDYGVKLDWDSGAEIAWRDGQPLANVDYPKYLAAIRELRERYGNRITLKTGLEFGVQVHTVPQFHALFQKYPLDFVILSVHQVENKEFWTQEFQEGRTQQEYNERYYQELLDLTKTYQDYSVLGHLDLIVRYDEQGVYPFEKVKPMVAEILRNAIQNGKGIELNTSFHRYGLSDSTPSRAILELYRDLGGEILTIGSDSHKPQHLGAYIQEGQSLLKGLGFKRFCTFEGMKPIFHSL